MADLPQSFWALSAYGGETVGEVTSLKLDLPQIYFLAFMEE